MPARTRDPRPIWERPEPADRPAPSPLSRDRIVAASIELADSDGLEAVSLRKVAAALEAGPMRLYGYVASKDELLDLLVDEVYGEIVAEPLGDTDWRARLRELAHRTRRAALAHEWFVELLSGRPHIGPNALARLEAALSGPLASPGSGDIDTALRVVGTIDAYVRGAVGAEIGELRAERQSGLAEPQWQMAAWPYLRRVLASGHYPAVARMVHDAEHPLPQDVFERGLQAVLDGVAVRFEMS